MDEGRKCEYVGLRDRVKDEVRFGEAMVIGVEREELGGEIGMVG
jgi:hypothetical protein